MWVGVPLPERSAIGLFRVTPCFDGLRRSRRSRPLEVGRNLAGLGWAKYKCGSYLPEEEPPMPVVDAEGVTSGRNVFEPSEQAPYTR